MLSAAADTEIARKLLLKQHQGLRPYGSFRRASCRHASIQALLRLYSPDQETHPRGFRAALLNSRPMGFYAPAEIVRCSPVNT